MRSTKSSASSHPSHAHACRMRFGRYSRFARFVRPHRSAKAASVCGSDSCSSGSGSTAADASSESERQDVGLLALRPSNGPSAATSARSDGERKESYGPPAAMPPEPEPEPSARNDGESKGSKQAVATTSFVNAAATAGGARPKMTNRHIFLTLVLYFVLPLAVLWTSSRIHDALTYQKYPTLLQLSRTGVASDGNCIVPQHFFLTINALLLGFETSKDLWHHIFESFLTASCWGITFLLIRKGLNPETKPHFIRRGGWRGAVLSSLSVFHSNFALRVVRLHPMPRRALCHYVVGVVMSRCCSYHGEMTAPRQSEEVHSHGRDEVLCSAVYDAVLVGVAWGMFNLFLRRRLDPALRDDLLRRHWRDVLCGSVALSVSSLAKSGLKHAWPRGVVEGMLSRSTAGRMLHGSNVFALSAHLFGLETELDFWHVAYEGVKIGACWGLTYLFIRRGFNRDTRKAGYVARYWRDAWYGGWGLFCYVFLRLVAKKWVPILALWLGSGLTRAVMMTGRDEL